jgi:hypothetical protein
MKRRQFLKAGLVGGAVLAAGSAWIAWRDLRDARIGDGDTPARDRVAIVTGAVAPVLLAGVLPIEPNAHRDGVARVIAGVKTIIEGFPAAVRGEIGDLFRTLDIRFARRLLTGVSRDWPDADPAEIAAFLERWRTSRIGLLQSGYFALHDLVLGAWYADPSAWDAIGYPGPPDVG